MPNSNLPAGSLQPLRDHAIEAFIEPPDQCQIRWRPRPAPNLKTNPVKVLLMSIAAPRINFNDAIAPMARLGYSRREKQVKPTTSRRERYMTVSGFARERNLAMALYSVHLKGSGLQSVAEAAFVRQAFSWKAFFFGPLWLAWHRLWIALLLWAAAYLILIAACARFFRPSPPSPSALPCKFSWVLKPTGCARQNSPPRVSSCRNRRGPRQRPGGNHILPPLRSARTAGSITLRHARRRTDREDRPVTVAIVDYGSGNLHSARKAFERAAREAGLSAPSLSRAIRTRFSARTASFCRVSALSPTAAPASTPCPAWSPR